MHFRSHTIPANAPQPRHQTDDIQALTGSPSWLVALPFFLLGMGFSLWYLEAYYAGDPIFYKRFYESLYGMPIQHWADFQRIHLGASEPLYRLVVGFGAYNGWDRVLYLSVWNGIFVAAIGYTLIKFRCSLLFSVFVLTNFYLLVLIGPAERLKFAYLVLMLAFVVENRWLKLAFSASSPFFHTQAMVQFASGIAYYLAMNFKKIAKSPGKVIVLVLFGAVLVTGISALFLNSVGQSLESKSAYYADQSTGVAEGIQWALILGTGLYVFKGKLAFLIAMVPMGVLTILFGNRVNVATFALFAALAILQRKTRNPIVLAVMAYMSFKSIAFLIDVIDYGDGFIGGA